jgi:hypothetical protein
MSAYSEATNLCANAWDFGVVNPKTQPESLSSVAPEFEVLSDSRLELPASTEETTNDEPVLAAEQTAEAPGKLWQSFEPAAELGVSPELNDEILIPEEKSIITMNQTESSTSLTRPHILSKLWLWTRSRVKIQPRKKRLKVSETVSLGEKRFIAVVQVDGSEFLVGGAPNALSVLAHLETPKTFPEILRQSCEQKPAEA